MIHAKSVTVTFADNTISIMYTYHLHIMLKIRQILCVSEIEIIITSRVVSVRMEQDGTDRGGGERDGGQVGGGLAAGEADALFTEVMNLLRSYLELLSNQSGDQNQERMLITEGK